MADEILIDSEEASRRLNISKRYFLTLTVTGKAPAGIKLGRRRLWQVGILEGWVASGCKRSDR